MSLKFTTMLLFIALFNFSATSQNTSDFIVIDEIADHVSISENQMLEQTNVFHTNGIKLGAIKQISIALENAEVEVLHIYVSTKPGALVFNSQSVTSDRVVECAEELRQWRSSVSQEVVIHSNVVFSGQEGELLKQKLEEFTGLTFTAKI
ncbi:MAG: DUF4347 domain-containing protein [Flavobacteriales bacterium]